MKKCILMLIVAVLLAPAIASAAEATLAADFLSAYVSKGRIGDDHPVFQPEFYVAGPYGFAADVWATMSLADSDNASWDPNTRGEWTEIDLDLSWTVPWSEDAWAFLTLGGTYFVYPQALDEYIEGEPRKPASDGDYCVYAKVTGNVLLSPSIKFAHNLNASDNWEVELGLGHDFPVPGIDPLSLSLGAVLGIAGEGYMDVNFGEDLGTSFNFVQVSAALNYAVNDSLTLSLKGFYSSLLDSDTRDIVKDTDLYKKNDYFYGGVAASYTF